MKLESPFKDYKIEKVKLTMLVKDEASNNVEEMNGDWNPETSFVPSHESNQ